MAATSPTNIYIKANGMDCKTVSVSRDAEKLNTCELKCITPIRTESGIVVTMNGIEIFRGIVKKCIKSDDKVHYKISAEETACQLMDRYHTLLDLPNIIIKALDLQTNSKRNIGYYLDKLPSHPIKSPNDSNNYSSMTTIPFTDIPLPDVQFGRMKQYTVYKTFLSDIMGVPFWFERGSTVPTYGICRSVVALQLPMDYILDSGLQEETTIPNYDSIVVIDDNRDKYGMAGSCHGAGIPTGTYQGVYQYDGTHTVQELNAMASAILKLKGTKTESWKVSFRPGAALQFREGDIIQAIGNQTVTPPMTYKVGSGGTNIAGYQVKSVEITENGTTLYIGNSKRTVFDVMKDRLRLVDGTGIPIATETKESDFIRFSPT